MNKFAKRISKSVKHRNSVLVLGTAFGNLEDLTLVFENVFLHADNSFQYPKKKNIIFLEEVDSHLEIPMLSMIFLDIEYLGLIGSLKGTIGKYSPAIMIGSGEFIDKSYSKLLNDQRYQIVELFKDYQLWKLKP